MLTRDRKKQKTVNIQRNPRERASWRLNILWKIILKCGGKHLSPLFVNPDSETSWQDLRTCNCTVGVKGSEIQLKAEASWTLKVPFILNSKTNQQLHFKPTVEWGWLFPAGGEKGVTTSPDLKATGVNCWTDVILSDSCPIHFQFQQTLLLFTESQNIQR